MASFTNTLKINYRIRDTDLSEDVQKEIRTLKTSTVYQRDRITMSAFESGTIHSFAPASGVGILIVSPINRAMGLKLNQSGPQIGIASGSCMIIQTNGAGNNTDEITSMKMYNMSLSGTLDIDIIHTD